MILVIASSTPTASGRRPGINVSLRLDDPTATSCTLRVATRRSRSAGWHGTRFWNAITARPTKIDADDARDKRRRYAGRSIF